MVVCINKLQFGHFISVILNLDKSIAIGIQNLNGDDMCSSLVHDLDSAYTDIVLTVVKNGYTVLDRMVFYLMDRIVVNIACRFYLHSGAYRDKHRFFLRLLQKYIAVCIRQTFAVRTEFDFATPVVRDANTDSDRCNTDRGATPDLIII